MQQQPAGKYPRLNSSQLDALRRDLDALKREVESQIGDEDLDYIRALDRVADASEVIGRVLLHLSVTPIGFGLGVLAMSNFYSMKAYIGHSIGHGCYERFAYARDVHIATADTRSSPTSIEVWAKGHNLHHAHTANEALDPDFNQIPGGFRLGNHFPWKPAHLVQMPTFLAMCATASWYQAVYYNGVLDPFKDRAYRWFLREPTPRSYASAVARLARESANHVLVDYVLFPLLAGPGAPKVLAGNLLGEIIANLWIAMVTLGTHYGAGDDLELYDERPGNKAQWYFRQIESTTDVALPKIFDHQTGALNLHVAHHLFPKLPPNRLIEITPRVEAICAAHGVPFRRQGLAATTRNVLRRVFKYSLPARMHRWFRDRPAPGARGPARRDAVAARAA